MIGWTLLEALLGGDAEEFLGALDIALPPEDEDDDLEGDLILPDHAESPEPNPWS